MSRLYLDACCIIYLIEATSPFHALVQQRLARHRSDPAAVLITSLLSRLECRVRALRDGDAAKLAAYDAFFATARLIVAAIDRAVIDRATDIRARYGFRTPDALHLATAIEQGAAVLLTGDGSLARCKEVNVEVITPP